jgi:hypothetical protein
MFTEPLWPGTCAWLRLAAARDALGVCGPPVVCFGRFVTVVSAAAIALGVEV